MSLNRVSSLETFHIVRSDGERSRRGSVSSSLDNSGRARKLTFNPLPESWNPVFAEHDDHPSQPVGAFEVPRWKRILQIVVTVIFCLFAAGIVFGYAAIKPVLKKEGAYQNVCNGDDTCVEIHLNLMFTVAAVVTNVAALPIGAILDHYGPRACGVLGAILLAIGALFLSFAIRLPFDAFLLGYLFLALGGPFTYISSFQLSNAFPRHSGLILALLTGAFDASSALFLVYRIIYESTGGFIGHHKFFLAYLVVPVVIVIFQFTVLPRQSYKTVGEMVDGIVTPAFGEPSTPPDIVNGDDTNGDDQVDEETALLRQERRDHHESVVHEVEELVGSKKADKQVNHEEAALERSGVWGVMHSNTAMEQICSPWFVLICLFTIVQMTRINYFVATIRPQYEAILGSRLKAIEINHFFDLALPLGGIISIPFIGVILDHTSTVAVLSTLVAVATTIGILGVLPYTWAAYANVVLFVLYRPFYYTAVSDYSAKVFGFRTFGTVYGTIICLSGLLNFSQSGLDYLFHKTFHGNPIPVNLLLLTLGLLVGVCLVGFVGVRVRWLKIKTEAAYMNAREY
ncbi:MFS general substrate transporter [Xylariaceae sp. FL0662B]|nr:MFS general substrate transporter [Xylariaceae sp. FL0662B]